MKNQYVGDIRDFEKYAVLRALSHASGLPLVVCWMLTADDSSGDGRKFDYLKEPARYRHLDTLVFDRLSEVVHAGERNVEAVERAQILDSARFFGRILKGGESSRQFFFAEFWESVIERSLVFFDPDTGVAPPSARKHRANAARFIFDDELADAYRRGHSLVVFVHAKRKSWSAYFSSSFPRLRAATGAATLFALHSAGVAFLVLPQPEVAGKLKESVHQISHRWQPMLTHTDSD